MLRVLSATALTLALSATSASAAIPDPIEFDQAAPSRPPGVAANQGFVSQPIDAGRPFNLVGLAWRGRAEPEIALRTRADDGPWTRWTPATGHHSRGTSEPVFVGRAHWVQYRMSRSVPGLRLEFVDTTDTARAVSGRQAATAAAGRPRIRTRSQWGGEKCPARDVNYGTVRAAIVHHTVTANGYSRAQVPAAILAVCRFHRNTNGWDDIGYNFLVDRFGRIWEGRTGGVDEAVVGAHAQGYNSQTTGISNLGTFTELPQSEAAITGMARLIRWKLAAHGVRVNGKTNLTSAGGPSARYPAGTTRSFSRVSGHRDTGVTACPGEQLYRQLPELRQRVGERLHPGEPLRVDGELPELVTYSATGVAFDGSLLDVNALPVEGAEMELQELGPMGWKTLASGVSASDGTFSVVATPTVNTILRWHFVGDETYQPYRGDGVAVSVAPAIALAASASTVAPDEPVDIGGSISPAKTQGVTLMVERLADGVWRRIARKKLKPRRGQIAQSRTFSEEGDYRVYVTFAGDLVNVAAVSAYVAIRVEEPLIPF